MDNESQKELGMATRAIYRITVKGKLAGHWSEWFNGSTISLEPGVKGSTHTVLLCQVKDQGELLGILNQLNSLNLALLQVNFVKTEGEEHV